MANYNRIILVGNLTRDPQLKYLPSQMPVVEFGLAVNHRWRSKDGQDREDVLFIDCSCFGKGAEVINTYCQKGKQLLVEGRLKLDVWEDKQGGGKRSKHTVVVENFQLMGSRGEGGAAASGASAGGAAPYEANGGSAPADRTGARGAPPARPAPRSSAPAPASPAAPAEPPYGQEPQFNEDDIPF